MRKIAIAALAFVVPTIAFAQDARDGRYHLRIDGGEGNLHIADGYGSITVVRIGQCFGEAEGPLTELEENVTRITDSRYAQTCMIDVITDSDGYPLYTEEQGGCFGHRGQSCHFHSDVLGPAVDINIQVLDAAFNRLRVEDRQEVQRQLQASDYYNGEIDGVIGPGTRGAIREAARADLSDTPGITLADDAGASDYLASLLQSRVDTSALTQIAEATGTPPPSAAEESTFIGSWVCGAGHSAGLVEFEFEADRATLTETSRYTSLEWVGGRPDAVSIRLANGIALGIFDVRPNSMILMTGSDIFDCER